MWKDLKSCICQNFPFYAVVKVIGTLFPLVPGNFNTFISPNGNLDFEFKILYFSIPAF